MIRKIVKGSSFGGCVNYLFKGEGLARLIGSEGIDPSTKQTITDSLNDQA